MVGSTPRPESINFLMSIMEKTAQNKKDVPGMNPNKYVNKKEDILSK